MADVHDGRSRLFRGWVEAVDISEGVARFSMRNGYQLEGRFRRFATSNGITPSEMVWSIGRIAGFSESQLHIEGFRPDPDRFHVAMPVEGIRLEEGTRFGAVQFTQDEARLRSALAFVDDKDWIEQLVEHGTWAIAAVEAGTLFDAEQQGAELIVATIDRLTVESQYSVASSPEGEVLGFQREDLFTDPRVERVALVRAATRIGRAWIRTLDMLEEPTPLARRRVHLVAPPIGRSPQFDEAIRSWRRALVSSDRIGAASAISEAIEFYTASAQPVLGFNNEEIGALQRAVSQATRPDGSRLELTALQRQRIDDLFGMLNRPSLKQSLLAALAADGVPFAREEVDRVWRVRSARNNFVHGRGRIEIDADDLDLARAFVNRLIVWWGRSERITRTHEGRR